MNRRIAILKNSLHNKSFGGAFSDWVLNTFALPCHYLAKKKIISIDSSDLEYFEVKIKGVKLPIYIAKSIGIQALEHVIAEQFYKWNWHYYEIPQTTVELGENVFDCGSAEGLFALLTHDRARKVFAFEPLEDYVNGLKATFRDVQNVHVINEAIGDRKGISFLKNGGIASAISDSNADNEIIMNTVDSFCFTEKEELNFLKADIEGYELQLLKGAKEAIFKFKPKLALTVYHKQNDINDIVTFLKAIFPDYKFKTKGITEHSSHYVMLHAWT